MVLRKITIVNSVRYIPKNELTKATDKNTKTLKKVAFP